MSPIHELLKLLEASDLIGPWLSAAMDDPKVCAAMKEDIGEWFATVEETELALGGKQE